MPAFLQCGEHGNDATVGAPVLVTQEQSPQGLEDPENQAAREGDNPHWQQGNCSTTHDIDCSACTGQSSNTQHLQQE